MKTSVQIPDEIYRQTKLLSDNFSFIVTQALKDFLKKSKTKKALAAFGSWEARDKDSVELVNDLRKDREASHADRSR
ncbi:MAG: hypothetical protein HY892_09775 [Deltaproteobacteria bacterium]|nr:hypothetical protein [Deltaproteobacteria bacterium]